MKRIALVLCFCSTVAMAQLPKIKTIKTDSIGKKIRSPRSTGLTNEEVIRGLREALSVGTSSAASLAGKVDGYYKNPRLYIPWPPEANGMKDKLLALGMQQQVNEFEISMNRAAEEAAAGAKEVFTETIRNLSVQDGFQILKGSDTAAIHYLRENSYNALYQKFLPVVKAAIEKVKVTSYWTPLVTTYNKIPLVKRQDPDLNSYVTTRAINGLMLLIADEEKNIRKNPAARVNDLLKKVFGQK